MESGLNKAFCGVYNSSKEIIKNNQRHLFCNMLDLLARTTKTTGDKYLNLDEFVLFWTTDILPMIFDEDKEIQESAITAMESVSTTFNFKTLHNSVRWNDIKTKIVQQYSKEIYKYRESSNSCWHRIWCILIRILDKEIIKGASTINAFLSIVELGFRSPDYNVRAEAFQCWKVLIEIFANNGEICSPKRIRLICIPLKSSHSKTTQAAAVKFKVWWFLITKLNVHIEQYVDAILEPFLAFCYGSVNRNSSCVSDFKEMTILCLIALMGDSTKMIKKRMSYFDIESLSEPIVSKDIMSKYWRQMINYTIEALKDCSSIKGAKIELSELLLRNIFRNLITIENNDAVCLLFEKLQACEINEVTQGIHKLIGSYSFAPCMKSIDNTNFIGHFLSALCRFVILNDTQTSVDSIEEIVKTIFDLKSTQFSDVLEVFINGILAETSPIIDTVIATWKLITKSLIKNFAKYHQNNVKYDIINQWIVWPLKASLQPNDDFQCYDNNFKVLLQMSIERLSDVFDKVSLLKELSSLLQTSYKLKTSNPGLKTYFECLVSTLLSLSTFTESNEELISVIFYIIKYNLSGDFDEDNFELCMKCLKGLVPILGQIGIDTHFGDIKDAWSQVINIKRTNNLKKVSFDDYRKQFLDDVKRITTKTQYNKIRNYLENDDLFVIIPSVWSLNPDKLTERQKEKFFEKSDIPALYNDMSQSQDAFIKPWTPKKLVIAKGHVEEIVIGEGRDMSNVNEALSPTSNIRKNATDNKCFAIDEEDPKISVPLKQSIQLKENIENTTLPKVQPKTDSTNTKNKINSLLEAQQDNLIRVTRSKTPSLEVEEIPNNTNIDDYVEQVEEIILKDTSSPPDRKQTNNSTSPVLKPKTTHLTGRGAQLINMIRNKKHDSYTTKQIESSTPVTKMEPIKEKIDAFLNWSSVDSEPKLSPMSLLVFSKTLPSPCASPSASILKRKHLNDSMDDVYDSQAFKRKRVSFHDPPVSVTKEYLKDEEGKHNSKRCLLLDQEQKGITKHLLRRSAKIENQSQNDQPPDVSGFIGTPPIKKVKCSLVSCEDSVTKNANEIGPSMSKTQFPLLFKTEADVLSYVVNQFSLEDVCEKYLSNDKSEKAGSNLSKYISNNMNVNTKFKSTILETLSEKHPKEFLDYAIQENLSSVVCDRLNSNSIIDYICSKLQSNTACRSRLLQEMQDILNHEKFADEKYEFLQKAVASTSMPDQQLLNLVEILFESRRKHQRAVSESAIDSSSTL